MVRRSRRVSAPVLFFGTPWGAPALDRARRVPAPVGDECLICGECIAQQDRGFIRVVVEEIGILSSYEVRAIHAECQLLGVAGHTFGVCECSGFDVASRASALVLWERIEATKATDRLHNSGCDGR